MGVPERYAVELGEVCVKYGSKTVLRGVNHVFHAGSSTAILGQNGAGKTTILRTIVGVVHPYRGWVKVFGLEAGTVGAKRLIGYLPERPGVYERLTALQNMLFHAELNGLNRATALERSMALLEAFGLAGVAHARVHTFSKGMKQRLALARTLLADPALLLLDEPTSGLDPDGANLTVSLLREKLEQGSTLIVSTHNPYFARRVSRDALIVADGSIKSRGELELLVFERKVRIRLLRAVDVGVISRLVGDGSTPLTSQGESGVTSEFEVAVRGGEEIAQIVEDMVKAGLRVVGVEPVESLPKQGEGSYT
jgi:ABC-2 type transport system ATP-binding protein